MGEPGYNSITSELDLTKTEDGAKLTFMFCDESPWDFEKVCSIIANRFVYNLKRNVYQLNICRVSDTNNHLL